MILCITPNPAIDRTVIVPSLSPGKVHRAERLIVAAGGKGLNVARAIHTLGGEPVCMGFVGGHNGRLFAELAQNDELNSFWTGIRPETRTCTIIISQNGDATLINEPGMPVSKSDWKRLIRDVSQNISSANLICVSGSFPPEISSKELQGFLRMLVKTGKQVWTDTSRAALDVALTCPGICIKVNGEEIGQLLGFEVRNKSSAKRALKILIDRGMRACVITLGSMGALLATQSGRWYARPPRVHVVSTVGSGDSFLGGLVYAQESGKDWSEALCDAIAAGTANALSEGGGKFTIQQYKDIQRQVQVEAW
jgi:1-phosphofructokinase family hexose kinase